MSEERRVTLPWKVLMHDNHRLIPAAKRKGLVQNPEYKARKHAAELVAKRQLRGLPLLTGELWLVAVVYFPDRRKRDAGNYRKLVTDALSGLAYGDDSELAMESWARAYDTKNPRCEVTVIVGPSE